MNQQKPSMIMPALIGGVFLGVTSAFPFVEFLNCVCCILVITGGVLASYVYSRDYPVSAYPIPYGEAAILGLLTGLIGTGVWTVVEIPLTMVKLQLGLGEFAEISESLNDPEIPIWVRELLAQGFAGGGLLIGLFFTLIISLIFATVGAIIGVAIFQKNYAGPPPPPDQSPVAPPPPPPTGTPPTNVVPPPGGETPPAQEPPPRAGGIDTSTPEDRESGPEPLETTQEGPAGETEKPAPPPTPLVEKTETVREVPETRRETPPIDSKQQPDTESEKRSPSRDSSAPGAPDTPGERTPETKDSGESGQRPEPEDEDETSR